MKKRRQSCLTGRSFEDGIELSMSGKHSLVLVNKGKITRQHKKRGDVKDLQQKDNIANIFILIILVTPFCVISNIADLMIYTAIAMFLEMILLGFTISDETKKYHSAEHMVINAFEKYQRIPTIQELRKTSPYSSTCGSSNVVFCSITIFLLGVYLKYSSREMLYIISLVMIVNIFLYINNTYKYIQSFMLKKPTDAKLNVALLALEELLKQLK